MGIDRCGRIGGVRRDPALALGLFQAGLTIASTGTYTLVHVRS
jgi:hypothetical protein